LRLYPTFASGKMSSFPGFCLWAKSRMMCAFLNAKRAALSDPFVIGWAVSFCDEKIGGFAFAKPGGFASQTATTLPLADLAATYSPAS
jgi:hypothetical protein